MPKRSSKKKQGPEDVNEAAIRITRATTDPAPEPLPPEHQKDPNAVALGRKGGQKGGRARAEKLSPSRRKAIAKKAAKARWLRKSNNK